MHIEDSKVVIITEWKIDFIRKNNELLAEHTIKNEISQLTAKYKHGSNIHEHEKQ